MSSTHARTTSPTSWRRASRPTDSAITRMASAGSMKHSGIVTPSYRRRLAKRTVGGRVDGILCVCAPARQDAPAGLLARLPRLQREHRAHVRVDLFVAHVCRETERRALRREEVPQRQL